MAAGQEKIARWARAEELGFIVVTKREMGLFSSWYKRCLRMAWPFVSVIQRGQRAEVKLDSFTTRRQSFTRSGAKAVRDVAVRWAEKCGARGVMASGWFGSVCFGVDGVPVDEAEQMASELLGAARTAEPEMFRRPRTKAEYERRVGFLEYVQAIGASPKAPRKDQKGGIMSLPLAVGKSDPSPLPTLSREQWFQTVGDYGGACAYCEKKGMLLLRDQLVPAIQGGEHALGNVVPACVFCNGRKAGRGAAEFLATNPDLTALRLRKAFGLPVAATPDPGRRGGGRQRQR